MRIPEGFLPVFVLILAAVGPSGASEPDAVELAAEIDRQIEERLSTEGVAAAVLTDDAAFVRRIYLDLHGVVPTREQVGDFLADAAPDKRSRLIDGLLADERYGRYLADIWQGYLISPLADDQKTRSERFGNWLADQFNARNWAEIATDLVTATGKMEDNPAVTYLIEGRLPRAVPDLTDLTSRYLLGIRLNCAQCHDHPFVDWKQEEFWGMAAFFTQIQTPKRAKQVYEKGVVDDLSLSWASLGDGSTLDGFMPRPPTFLGGREVAAALKPAANRAVLAEWMTAPDNPYFARAMANRTWWRLMGRGIVEPVDDMHAANAPSHPELMNLLAARFAGSGYDHKFLTRAIVSSHAYQRSSQPGKSDDERQAALYGRMSVKVLSAGQLHDSLQTICGPPAKVPGIDARQGARWEFTQFFGESSDPDPKDYRRGIPHLLRQMNSGQFAGSNLDSVVEEIVSSGGQSTEGSVTDLFLTILSRKPGEKELARTMYHIKQTSGPEIGGLRELAWVLLMTSEFSLNH